MTFYPGYYPRLSTVLEWPPCWNHQLQRLPGLEAGATATGKGFLRLGARTGGAGHDQFNLDRGVHLSTPDPTQM
jgi:hypothetical protein